MDSKFLYLLIGQKGSAKSFIGSIFEKEFGIRFIRVENWAKQIKKDRAVDNEGYLKQVFDEIENGIRYCLNETDNIVFESTGMTEHFDQMLESLKRDFQLTTIGIYADISICLDRVKYRDQAIHINLSDDQVLMINEKARKRNFKTDFYINNENKSEKELIYEIRNIIGQIFNS